MQVEKRFLFTSDVSELKNVKPLIEFANQQYAVVQDNISVAVNSVLNSTINDVCEYVNTIMFCCS